MCGQMHLRQPALFATVTRWNSKVRKHAMSKNEFPLPQDFMPEDFMPEDWRDAVLVGRIDMGEGPTPVVVTDGRMSDVSATAPTVSELLEKWKGVPEGKDLGDINDLGLQTAWSDKQRGGSKPKIKLLA